MDEHHAVGALKHLEGRKGTHPSTKELAEQMGCAEATAIKYLQVALALGLITQRAGHYMTLEVARAFDAQKDKEVSKK